MRPVICLVSDRRRAGGDDRLIACVRAAAAAGVHLVQIREKDLEARALTQLVARAVDAVHGTRARVVVNDRVDVALAAGAHGVHLPSYGPPAARLPRPLPPGFIVGRSVHGVEEARAAATESRVDYLLFGTVFESGSKPGSAAAGVQALRSVAHAVPVPVLAIGGVTVERLHDIARAGATGFAAIGLFADAANEGPDRLQSVVKQATLLFDTPPDDT